MSYRRAWQLVDTINRMFLQAAVESQRGGKQGGGAVVTPFGEELIRRFRHMEMLVVHALKAELDWLETQRSPFHEQKITETEAVMPAPKS